MTARSPMAEAGPHASLACGAKLTSDSSGTALAVPSRSVSEPPSFWSQPAFLAKSTIHASVRTLRFWSAVTLARAAAIRSA